ncbi:hypothetical protein MVEN_02402500 [Mycena venus]|uniref:Uncharacterized protein n=1 Tax=Mycena venus TaxID=2733690 RepID=A0A8H7CDW4_9AGAR|nr:hypothetical protein MVEN_02402500 [Mycena venus]
MNTSPNGFFQASGSGEQRAWPNVASYGQQTPWSSAAAYGQQTVFSNGQQAAWPNVVSYGQQQTAWPISAAYGQQTASAIGQQAASPNVASNGAGQFVRGLKLGFRQWEGAVALYEGHDTLGIFGSYSVPVPLLVVRPGYNNLHMFSRYDVECQKLDPMLRMVQVDDPRLVALCGKDVFCVFRAGPAAQGAGPAFVDSLKDLFKLAKN